MKCGINLIFDKQGLFKEIKLIFDTEKKELFTPKELSRLGTDHWHDLYYSDLAYETLRRIAGNKDVTMESVKAANNNWDWDWFCIREIYEKMQMNEELELPQDQQKWIAEWCRSNLGKVDFRKRMRGRGVLLFDGMPFIFGIFSENLILNIQSIYYSICSPLITIGAESNISKTISKKLT
jgi:hypothetical protein